MNIKNITKHLINISLDKPISITIDNKQCNVTSLHLKPKEVLEHLPKEIENHKMVVDLVQNRKIVCIEEQKLSKPNNNYSVTSSYRNKYNTSKKSKEQSKELINTNTL